MFFKETDFQDTPIGEAPRDWQVLKLGDDKMREDIFYGITAKATERNTGLKMLRTTDIKNYSADWEKLPFCEITEGRNALGKYILKKGDIVIARAGTVGVSVLVDRDFSNVIFGSYLIKVKLKSSLLPEFVHYFLQSSLYWKHIGKAQGSTLKNINLPILKSLSLPVPSPEEQKMIVGVLSVVDLAVAKAGESIAKTERLKKGLMQELLTKGIGHKEYKQTPIGKIPKEWGVMKLEEALDRCQYGLSVPSTEGGRYPIVRMDELVNGYVSSEITKSVDLDYETFRAFKLEKGDILFNRTNSYELVGRTAMFQLVGDYVFASYLIRLRPKIDTFDPHFLTLYLIFSHGRLQQLATRAVHQANINATNLQKITVPRPPLEEQRKIASILQTMDTKLELEKKEKARLERIKRGLMDLLLTGKIRVKVD